MEAELYLKACPEEYYAAFLGEKVRPDGRGLMEARKVAVELGVRGERSAVVRMGNSSLICVVDLEAASSLTIVGGTSPALCSFFSSQSLPGATQFQLIEDDGNLLEAGLLAYQLSLLAPLPTPSPPLPISTLVFAFAYCDLQNSLLRDPTKEEAALSSAELTIICSGDGEKVLPVKVSGKPVALGDVERLMELARRDLEAVRSNLNAIVTQRKFVGSLYLPRPS